MNPVRFMWYDPAGAARYCDVSEYESSDSRPRSVKPPQDPDFPGPNGDYRLLDEEIWRTISADDLDPIPVALHEELDANLEKWETPLGSLAEEPAAVIRTRDAVMQLVESRLTNFPGSFSASATLTSTERTPRGISVVGRCVVLRKIDTSAGDG